LSGVLVCGRCGTPLVGRPQVSRTPSPDGEKARQYRCEKRIGSRSGCGRISIDMRFADDLAEALTIARLAALARGGGQDGQAADAAAELSEVPADMEPMEGDAASPAAKAASPDSAAQVEAETTSLEERVEVLRGRPKTPERSLLPAPGAAALQEARNAWAALEGDTTARRALIARVFPAGLLVHPAASRGLGARHNIGRVTPREP
jgi:hypothetical protein